MEEELKPLPLGIAVGIAFGLCIFGLGLMATFMNWGTPLVNILGSAYIGYAPTVIGSIIGFVWAFLDSLVFIFIAAWIYNLMIGYGKK